MIGQECMDELADFVGLKAHVSAITERAMRGEIAFEPALARARGLAERPAGRRGGQGDRRADHADAGRDGFWSQTMRKAGAFTCLVSGGFTLFTQRIADMIGFDENRGNTLAVTRRHARRRGRRADPRARGQAGDACSISLHGSASGCGHHGGRRRRQRSRHDREPPASASPITPSRRSRPPRMRASTTATSPRCFTCRDTSGTSSRPEVRPRTSGNGSASDGRAAGPQQSPRASTTPHQA